MKHLIEITKNIPKIEKVEIELPIYIEFDLFDDHSDTINYYCFDKGGTITVKKADHYEHIDYTIEIDAHMGYGSLPYWYAKMISSDVSVSKSSEDQFNLIRGEALNAMRK